MTIAQERTVVQACLEKIVKAYCVKQTAEKTRKTAEAKTQKEAVQNSIRRKKEVGRHKKTLE